MDDDEDVALIRQLRLARDRRAGLDSGYDDITDTDQDLGGEWSEWMCPRCGVFMRDSRRTCARCHEPRC